MKSLLLIFMLALVGCSTAPTQQSDEEQRTRDQHTWSERPHWDRVYR